MKESYKQSKAKNQFEFKFQSEELLYSLKSSNTSSVSEIPYTSITREKWEFHEKNEWFRNVGVIWIGLGVIFEIPNLIQGEYFFPLWSVLGTIMLGIYFYNQTEFTVIQTERDRILVIKDKQHDEIVQLIFEKRKEALKKIHGEINYAIEPETEKKKFDLLVKEEIVSPEERDEAYKAIDSNRINKPIPSPFT